MLSEKLENLTNDWEEHRDGEDEETAWKTLDEVILEDREMQDFVAAAKLGLWEVDEMERDAGISKERVYELRRKLNAYLTKAAKNFKLREEVVHE